MAILVCRVHRRKMRCAVQCPDYTPDPAVRRHGLKSCGLCLNLRTESGGGQVPATADSPAQRQREG